MKVYLVFAILATAVAQLSGLNVTVFYETLCRDSKRFITTQLAPNYDGLKDHIYLDFVPFGKASYTTKPWSICCQHGPRECKGNIMQACALDQYEDNETRVKFVACVMGDFKSDTAGEKCAKNLGLPYDGVKNCTDTDKGRKLIAELGDRTLNFNPKITFVPTLAYNGVYNKYDQDQSLEDFTSVVCRKIRGKKPSACTYK